MYQISSFIEGNAVRNLTPTSKVIQLDIRPAASNYTAQGKRKPTAGDPIRSLADIQLFKDYFHSQSLRNYLLFVLGISVGIRGNDLLRLQVRDVITPNGFVVDEVSTFESKTHKMNHPMLNNEAKSAIGEYLNSLPKVYADDYLFKASPDVNKQLETGSLRAILLRAKAKLQPQITTDFGMTVRTLRKTFAYWIIKQHYDDPLVMASLQEMLNHDSMATTLHYSGHTRDNIRTMYSDMGAVLNGTAKSELPQTPTVEQKLDMLLSALNLDAE